jgi:hypothetical protein
LYRPFVVKRRTASRAAVFAVVAAALVWVAALVVPVYSGSSSTGRSSRATLVDVNGPRVLVLLAIPIAIALIGLLAVTGRLPRSALPVACALMWMWTIITGFSVGLFYLPADVALIVAFAAMPPRRRTSSTRLPA